MIDYTVLKNELLTDPLILGYATSISSGNDTITATIINLKRSSITIVRNLIPSYEVWEAIIPTEWAALTANEKQRIQMALSLGIIMIQGVNTRASFAAAFGAGTTTRTNLLALQTHEGSRAEQLFGEGVIISHSDIAIALRQT